MATNFEDHYPTRLQGIHRQGGRASALDLEAGETVTWKVVDRTHLLLVRLPERKPLQGVARPSGQKPRRRGQESRS
jgi:hypothetical protein